MAEFWKAENRGIRRCGERQKVRGREVWKQCKNDFYKERNDGMRKVGFGWREMKRRRIRIQIERVRRDRIWRF